MDPIAEARRHWQDRGWHEAAEGMAAVTSIMRTQQILLARIEKVLRPHELTFARFELLALLSFTREGALPMAKASMRLQVHPTSVTNTVHRLEGAGLVQRGADPDDGRTKLVEITPQGRALVAQATLDLNAQVFAKPGFTAPEVDRLNEVLGRFRHSAGDFAETRFPI
jgi:DNA-binding MarR family transcriptional regulator